MKTWRHSLKNMCPSDIKPLDRPGTTRVLMFLSLAVQFHQNSLLLKDCESAEAESGIAQTTVGMYIFRSECAGVGPGDHPMEIGVEVLQCQCSSVSVRCLMLFGLDLCA